MKYDNTNLVDPLVERDSDTVKQVLFHCGQSDWDGSKFVDQLRFEAHDYLTGTEVMEELKRIHPEYRNQMFEIEKSLLKFYLRCKVEGHPQREHVVQTSRTKLEGLWAPQVSRWNKNPIPSEVIEHLQWETDTPVCFKMELAEAYFKSETYLSDEKNMKHRKRCLEELRRIGDSGHHPLVRKLDRRLRTFDDHSGMLSHQGDLFYKMIVWFGEALPVDSKTFFGLTQQFKGINENNWENLLEGNLSKCIDKYGVEYVSMALACREYTTTEGLSSFPFAFDQSCSGAGFESILEQSVHGMRLGNLLGGPRQDNYMEVCCWLQSMDRHLRDVNPKELRTTAKDLGRGGLYEAGGTVAAYYLMGLDPDKMEKLQDADFLFLEEHVEPKAWMLEHPNFRDLFKNGKCCTTWDDVFETTCYWCTKVGMPALHEAIPVIRSCGKRLRDANEKHVKKHGKMLSWCLPHGGCVEKIPYRRDPIHRHVIRASHLGYRGKATLLNSSYSTNQNVSADMTHSVDGLVKHGVQLGSKNYKEPFHVLSNHDSFTVHARYSNTIQTIWRNSVVHNCRRFNYPALCESWDVQPPKGIGHDEVMDLIPNHIVALFP